MSRKLNLVTEAIKSKTLHRTFILLQPHPKVFNRKHCTWDVVHSPGFVSKVTVCVNTAISQ